MNISIEFNTSTYFEYAAFVLDLRAKFPCVSETQSRVIPWRERVLELEQDLVNLHTKCNQDHIST